MCFLTAPQKAYVPDHLAVFLIHLFPGDLIIIMLAGFLCSQAYFLPPGSPEDL